MKESTGMQCHQHTTDTQWMQLFGMAHVWKPKKTTSSTLLKYDTENPSINSNISNYNMIILIHRKFE
jgi:hypothetical protein